MTNTPKLEIVINKHDKHDYHARIKDTKRTADDVDIYTVIGRLVFENQDVFDVKINIESKKKVGFLNTNPGSSLPRSDWNDRLHYS